MELREREREAWTQWSIEAGIEKADYGQPVVHHYGWWWRTTGFDFATFPISPTVALGSEPQCLQFLRSENINGDWSTQFCFSLPIKTRSVTTLAPLVLDEQKTCLAKSFCKDLQMFQPMSERVACFVNSRRQWNSVITIMSFSTRFKALQKLLKTI